MSRLLLTVLFCSLFISPVMAQSFDQSDSQSATSRNAGSTDNTTNLKAGTDQGHKITGSAGEDDNNSAKSADN